jgi:hypothetical protein
VRRALAAADDELRHAVGTARASLCYGGAPIELGRVSDRTRAPARGKAALVRLAVESFVDGCLGEGRAAEAARRESEAASLDKLRGLQSMIAVDESRHAELAWEVLEWTVAAGGDDVRHALHAVRDASPAEASGSDIPVDLSGNGLLSRSRHDAIGEVVREHALPRLDAVLG